MKKLLAWLDNRTGYQKLAQEALYENIPGGSRWRYVWGSTLTFAIAIQFITGIFLWTAYSANTTGAWESVYYIQFEMTGGWLVRGLHHYTAQLMIILLALHLMQVVIDGAYKAPREVNFWFGLFLLLITLALSLTGYLLPWDQKGYWATKVSTNLVGITPGAGTALQKLIMGGTDYGHHTLTRFFALHAGVLPALLVLMIVGHVYLFRRHGITPKQPLRKRDEAFWPEQVLKDAVACLAVLATVLFLILYPRLTNPNAHLGAELGAPADPSEAFSAARPEWYFLFLFQFLKYFPGHSEIVGAIIIPSLVMLVLFLMPLAGRWRFGHRFNVGFLFALLAGAGLLTYLAKRQDLSDPTYLATLKDAHRDAARAQVLASQGIPPEGALALLKTDPYTQGPKLFAKNCASCHRYDGHDGMGGMPTDPATAPDLKGFGSVKWLTEFMDTNQIDSPKFYGGTKFKEGRMVRFVKRDIPKFTPEEREQLRKVIIALAAEADLPAERATNQMNAAIIAEGRELAKNDTMRCTECHEFRTKDEDATGPSLTGWGSREWLIGIISNSAHERFYGKRNDRMPAFGADNVLDMHAMGLIADWLREDWPLPGQTALRK
ncbi:MAG TPA: cytochrome b N-terminal domain-containing protein [Methylomirabilota bacterium]|nr:cytochrome b N-terminal domain-containing protein [Methylomirabilota bacterium]